MIIDSISSVNSMTVDAKELKLEIIMGDKVNTIRLVTLLGLLIEEVKDSPTFMSNFNVAIIKENYLKAEVE